MLKFVSFIVLTGLMAFLFLADVFAGSYRSIDEAFNRGHILLFGIIALAVLNLINFGKNKEHSVKLYVWAGAITIVIGYITEYIQNYLPGREFDLHDLLHDAIGAGIFLANWFAFSNNKISRAVKRNIFISSTLLIGIFFLPAATALIDEQNMREDFPMISSFERPFEISRWKAQASKINRTSIYRTHGEYSMQVHLNPGEYPGVSTSYFSRDWRDYDTLSFDMFLAEPEPLEIVIRINDKEHIDGHEDNYHKTFLLNPRLSEITIPLKDVMYAHEERTMDMSSVTQIIIFSYNLKKKTILFIDNIRLSKRTFL